MSRGPAKKGKTVAPLAAGQGGEGALCDCGLRHLELANWGGSTEAGSKYQYRYLRYEAMIPESRLRLYSLLPCAYPPIFQGCIESNCHDSREFEHVC